jgi:plastocyanin
MRTSTALGILAAIIIVGGGLWWYTSQQAPAADTNINITPGTGDNTPAETGGNTDAAGSDAGMPDDGTTTSAPMSATVTYGQAGFTPQQVTIKKGGTVTWTNQGGGTMWVASAQHPTHTTYSGTTLTQHCDDATDTSFDQCKNGSSYSFTFNKVGTWAYHNHAQASQFGKVIVVE